MNKNDNIYKKLYSEGLRGEELKTQYDIEFKTLLKNLDQIVEDIDDEELVQGCREGKCQPYSSFRR